MKLKCLIVDDEPLAREGLSAYVQQLPFLQLEAVCDDALQAGMLMKSKEIDLLLLDIQMPVLNGIEFLKTITHKPLCIITTAYPNYAVEGYELDVTDYLLKPVSFERFTKAANKAYDIYMLKHKQGGADEKGQDYVFVKSDMRYEKILIKDILYIEGLQNYLCIYTQNRKYIAYITMKQVTQQLPENLFIRPHKSFIVSVLAIEAMDGNELIIGKQKIPVSRDRKEEILKQLIRDKLLRRD